MKSVRIFPSGIREDSRMAQRGSYECNEQHFCGGFKIPHSRGSRLLCREAPQTAPCTGSRGAGVRPPANRPVSEPPRKQVPQLRLGLVCPQPCLTSSLQPCDSPWARSTQRRCSQIPCSRRNWWDNTRSLFQAAEFRDILLHSRR